MKFPSHLSLRNKSPMVSRPATQRGFSNQMMGTLQVLREEIESVDSTIAKESQTFRAKHRREPSQKELETNPKISTLLEKRRMLTTRMYDLIQRSNIASSEYNRLSQIDPVKSAQMSFSGIKAASPFSNNKEYKRPISMPAMSPTERVFKEPQKMGSLWDPNFNMRNVGVHPKIKKYYGRIGGLF